MCLRSIRFFLSRLIFEKLSGWCPAQKKFEEVNSSVEDYNKVSSPCCSSCGAKLDSKRWIGGVLSSPLGYYECPKCGVVQLAKVSEKILTDELEKVRILRDGNEYRYFFISSFLSEILLFSFQVVFLLLLFAFIFHTLLPLELGF